MIKLIALDLDGTLLDPSGRITPGAKEAIAQAREKGVRVVLNTGRPIPEAIWFAREAGCDNLISCLGGAALVDGSTGMVLRRRDIPEPSDRQVLELCLGRRIELMIFAGDQILLDPFSKDSLLRTYPYPAFHDNAVVTEDPLAYMEEHGLPLTKIHGDWNPSAYPLEALKALPGVELTCSNDHDFEVVAAGVDKGKTLALLAMMYGVLLQDCAAVGDSDNDLPMLKAVGTPIAMGNASAAIKEIACRTAPANGEEGVAAAILSCLELN
ncbi:Cof-type HAD-IIB family hydrolase [Pseudoflavonifractor phocaeensis]|uniref:Cof-type HAD-IIB family hydrolase n=1 Tax=Pseudoflavonifractor phocaeensis TaxID=1870988 RepID=UPI001F404C79|nr:Cof-type HAD-IIB family hydrolase [Pseudoflavonifractor phocaeensis]MCF2596808.1 Cof-type HAD-IIB family hydrolase [Pseudoflavonifractor phocaeensis]